jgi:hypothetical protein
MAWVGMQWVKLPVKLFVMRSATIGNVQKTRIRPLKPGEHAALRLQNGIPLAEGIPFSGSSRICENRSLPLKAIVYLTQAPQTRCTRLTGAAAFARVWEGISVNTWDRDDLEAVSHTLEQLLDTVPVYQLDCTPDESAVTALRQCIRK